jgi:hypothetical protein
MLTRSSLITVCGALLGLALTAATLQAVPQTGQEYVTFSGSVRLPGVTLAAGTYVFQVADLMATRDVILVRNQATGRGWFLMTNRVDRPAGLRHDESVVLGEVPKGTTPPIIGWYPIGESTGHEFIYKKAAR